jgi:hypothetical protein
MDRLANAEDDVAEGERHLARQRDILRLLRSARRETADAEVLLIDFQSAQALSIRELVDIRAQLEKLSQ